jgi:phospholipid transport system substrate-binding protein
MGRASARLTDQHPEWPTVAADERRFTMKTKTTAHTPQTTRAIALILGLAGALLLAAPTAIAEEAKAATAPSAPTATTETAPETTPETAPKNNTATVDAPRAIVAAGYEKIKGICAEPIDEQEMRTRIKVLTVDFVDYEEFSRLTIKRQWKDLSAAQRTEFVEWFRRLIQATYARHFKARQDVSVTYRGETKYKGEKAQVQTTVNFEKDSGTAVDVDYRFHKRATEAAKATAEPDWWVYDLVIDEVSLMRNYRGQFRKILKRDGFEALMTKVRDAVKRKESADDSSNEL